MLYYVLYIYHVLANNDDYKFHTSYQCKIIQTRWHTTNIHRLITVRNIHAFTSGLP